MGFLIRRVGERSDPRYLRNQVLAGRSAYCRTRRVAWCVDSRVDVQRRVPYQKDIEVPFQIQIAGCCRAIAKTRVIACQ